MAVLSRAIGHYLATDVGINAIVSGRVQPQPLGEVALPAITYYFIPRMPEPPSHSGDTGLETTMVQIDCWARTHDQAQRLAEAVKTAFHGRSGSMGVPPDQYGFGMGRVRMMRDARDPESNTPRVIVDVEVKTYAV